MLLSGFQKYWNELFKLSRLQVYTFTLHLVLHQFNFKFVFILHSFTHVVVL